MTEQINTGTVNNDQPATLEGTLADSAEDLSLPTPPTQETTQDRLALIKENRTLKERLEQLERRQEKAIQKFNQVQELNPYQAELIQLQQCLERRGKKMIIIFEGRGGAGKGGTIRRITRYMNAKHYRIVALGKPTAEERSQWFYQKYVQEFPRAGEIVLFEGSWYARAMIEPVFNFCTDKEYRDFMGGVGGFEMDLIRQNIILIKLYFSVTREEQTRRFEQRRGDPLQRWKLNEVDLDAEERRDEFTEAKYQMLKYTHTVHAPWTIIRSDIKHQARLNAMKVILNAVDYDRLNPELDLTRDPSVAVSGAHELESMEALRLREGRF